MIPTAYPLAPLRALLVLVLAVASAAHAGTLSLGQPAIQGDQYSFPVALAGADGQVSALDFRVQFDPRIFVPVSAAAGPAALAANKMVSANNPAPGQYVVVMMGLNQATVPGGIVASLLFQRTGDGEGALSTDVGISDLTLAGPDGSELAASGSSVRVPLREAQPGETTEGEDPDPTTPEPDPATPEEAPANPNTPTGETPNAPAEPPARRMLAGAPVDNATPPPPADPSALAPARAANASGGNSTAAVGSNNATTSESPQGDAVGTMPERSNVPQGGGTALPRPKADPANAPDLQAAPASASSADAAPGAAGAVAARSADDAGTPPRDAALPGASESALTFPMLGGLALLGVVLVLLLRVWRRARN